VLLLLVGKYILLKGVSTHTESFFGWFFSPNFYIQVIYLNEELRILQSLPDIITMMMSERIWWRSHKRGMRAEF
jgi:hypothetical protein